jgi:uncharacterized membrane protein
MKSDIGIYGYPFKVAGVVLSAVSLAGFAVCKLTGFDPPVVDNLSLIKLFPILFACGLIVFLYSKDKNDEENYIRYTNTISRFFLTALYSCLVAYSFIQSMTDKFEIDVLAPVIFFLVMQTLYTVVIRMRDMSNKGFYIFSTVVFVAGLIILWFL